MSEEQHYDVVVIGLGPAGLYFLHRMLQDSPSPCRILAVEQCRYVGGRTKMANICSNAFKVATGAGVVRLDKDVLLQKLLRDFQVPVTPFTGKVSPPNKKLIMHDLNILRRVYDRKKHGEMTFHQYFMLVLKDEARYSTFCKLNGLGDFALSDAGHALDHYGFEDNVSGQRFGKIDWDELWTRVWRSIRSRERIHVHFQTKVVRLTSSSNPRRRHHRLMLSHLSKGTTTMVRANTVVIATAKGGWSVNRSVSKTLGASIFSIPFLRVYCCVKKGINVATFLPSAPTTWYTGLPNQKVSPVHEPRAYQIAYCDSENAERIHGRPPSQEEWQAWTGDFDGWDFRTLRYFFHREGTHGFHPFGPHGDIAALQARLQHPLHNVWVIGEAVSTHNQGWTEGALESTEWLFTAQTRLMTEESRPSRGRLDRINHELDEILNDGFHDAKE